MGQSSTDSNDIDYSPHSMTHRAIVKMDPTKLEMIDGFEQISMGHKYTPNQSNVRVIILGRNWSKKRFLIYGAKSTEEAESTVNEILDKVREIGHDAKLVEGPVITNIAVSGNLGFDLKLEKINNQFTSKDIDTEYEPEQFPALIVKLQSPSVTFLLFSTGSFIIQGLKNKQDIDESIQNLLDHLQ